MIFPSIGKPITKSQLAYSQFMNFLSSPSKGTSEPDQETEYQDIVPGELVLQFVSMAKLATSHDVDNDLAHHCAYNLPAVVLTLGSKHWDLLSPAYKALAEAVDVS